MIKVLKDPIKVRGYAMFDKFKLRGILRYDNEGKRLVISCSYGYEKSGKFVPSEMKEHHFSMEFVGEEFDRLNARIRKGDQGNLYDLLEKRVLEMIQENRDLFKEEVQPSDG